MSKKNTNKKHPHASLHSSAVGFLVAGIVVLSAATHTTLFAQDTSQGSTLVQERKEIEMLLPGSRAVGLTAPERSIGRELAIGSLLILTGVFLHALVTLRTEHPVNVIAQKKPRIRIREIYWMKIF
ncbi:MAG: hypothetical protein AAB489_03265 [Patescibacteria group bacterium]